MRAMPSKGGETKGKIVDLGGGKAGIGW